MTSINLQHGNIKVFNSRAGHNFNTIPGYVAPVVSGGQGGGEQGGQSGGDNSTIPDNVVLDHHISEHGFYSEIKSIASSSNGNTIVIGYPERNGTNNYEGVVMVYHYNGADWDSILLTSPNPDLNGKFGSSVSINDDGTRISISSWLEDINGYTSNGGIYIFEGSGTSWTQTDHLFVNGSNEHQRYQTMSGDGNTIMALKSSPSAIVWYEYDGSSAWVEKNDVTVTSLLNHLDISSARMNLNTDGSRLVVSYENSDLKPDGTYQSGGNYGSVVVYTKKDANTYSEDQRLSSNEADTGYYDRFGTDFDISDDGSKIVVGAWNHSTSGNANGKAYVFEWGGSSYSQTTTHIQEPSVEDNGYFGDGIAVSPDGTTYFIAASQANIDSFYSAGKVFEYDFATNTLQNTLVSPVAANERYGQEILFTGDGVNFINANYNGLLRINKTA